MNIEETILKKIEHGTEIVFKTIILYSCHFEFAMIRSSNKINLHDCHKHIFEAMKLVDNVTIIITNLVARFEHTNDFPSGQKYVKAPPQKTIFKNNARYSYVTK